MNKKIYFLAIILIFLVGGATPTFADRNLVLETSTPSLSPTPTIADSSAVDESSATPLPTPTPTPEPIPVTMEDVLPIVVQLNLPETTFEGFGPDNFPFFINPLTGLLTGDPEILNRRPMAIKVTNHPRYVRPQAGLTKADIVYEYYLEDGVSRFIAIFYGEDAEKVGPVRSARLFDEHIFRMYDSIFVFGNADKRVMSYFLLLGKHFRNSFVIESPYDHGKKCGVDLPNRLCRDPELSGYNTMFANTIELERVYDQTYGNYRPDLTGMYFSNRVPHSNTLGLSIRVRYSYLMYSLWEYDIVSGRYLRYQETQEYPDANIESYMPLWDVSTGEQIAVENLVTLIVPHDYYNKTEGDEINNIFLQGSGRAIVFRDGFSYEAVWVRPTDGGVLQLFTPQGDLFPLKPGKTWFEVMNQYSEISNSGMGWRFSFFVAPVPNGNVKLVGEEPLDWFFRDQNPNLPMP